MLQALKLRYKKKLIRRLIIEDDVGKSIVEYTKSVTMKTVTKFIGESWSEIQPLTLRRSWRKIIAMPKAPEKTKSTTESGDKTDRILAVLMDAVNEDSVSETDSSAPDFVSPVSKWSFNWQGIRTRIESQQTEEASVQHRR